MLLRAAIGMHRAANSKNIEAIMEVVKEVEVQSPICYNITVRGRSNWGC
jgi:hypothetical protein